MAESTVDLRQTLNRLRDALEDAGTVTLRRSEAIQAKVLVARLEAIVSRLASPQRRREQLAGRRIGP